MTIRFSDEGGLPADLLAVTEGLYLEAAEELARALRGIRRHEAGEVRAAVKAVRDLGEAYTMVILERERVERHRREIAGAVGTGSLDLGAARDEIGRRLARLRDTSGS